MLQSATDEEDIIGGAVVCAAVSILRYPGPNSEEGKKQDIVKNDYYFLIFYEDSHRFVHLFKKALLLGLLVEWVSKLPSDTPLLSYHGFPLPALMLPANNTNPFLI